MALSDWTDCEHGASFCKFLSTLLQSVSSRRELAVTVLTFLDEQEDKMFGPARMFILKALLDGVADGPVFTMPEDLALLLSVSRMRMYASIKRDITFEVCLRLLFAMDLQHIAAEELFDALVEIVSGNEELFTVDIAARFHDFLAEPSPLQDKPVYEFLLSRLERALVVCKAENPSLIDLLKAYLPAFILTTSNATRAAQDASVQMAFKDDEFFQTSSGLRFLGLVFKVNKISGGHTPSSFPIAPILNSVARRIIRDIGDKVEEDASYVSEFASILEALASKASVEYDVSDWLKDLFEASLHVLNKASGVGDSTSLHVEKQRAHTMSICIACVSLNPNLLAGVDSFQTAVDLIAGYPLPQLSANKHDKFRNPPSLQCL